MHTHTHTQGSTRLGSLILLISDHIQYTKPTHILSTGHLSTPPSFMRYHCTQSPSHPHPTSPHALLLHTLTFPPLPHPLTPLHTHHSTQWLPELHGSRSGSYSRTSPIRPCPAQTGRPHIQHDPSAIAHAMGHPIARNSHSTRGNMAPFHSPKSQASLSVRQP